MTKRRSEMTPSDVAAAEAWNEKRREERAAAKAVPHAIIPPGHHVKGVSTSVNAAGEMTQQWIKTAKDHEEREEVLARLLVELSPSMPVRPHAIERMPGPSSSELLAVYPLGDPHVGLLAWAPESGDDFDLERCERLMTAAMRDLVLRGPRTDRALILNLGDFFHADSGARTTTKGTVVEADTRTPLVLAVGLRIMTTLIDAALEHHRSVVVDNRIGNHDGHTSLMLSVALGAYYRNEPRVSVPATIAHRSYHVHGANLIGVTHGDRAKPESLPEIMAAERPKEWGEARHRVWYVGHVHHSSVKDYRGCRVESFRTLAARDGWHSAEGYVAARDMHRLTLHASNGEISREIVNVPALLAS